MKHKINLTLKRDELKVLGAMVVEGNKIEMDASKWKSKEEAITVIAVCEQLKRVYLKCQSLFYHDIRKSYTISITLGEAAAMIVLNNEGLYAAFTDTYYCIVRNAIIGRIDQQLTSHIQKHIVHE